MITASRASARAGIGRGLPVEQRENRLQLGAQVVHRLRGEGAPRLRVERGGAGVRVDLLSRPVDGVLLRVQEVLDQHDQLDLAPLVDTVAGTVLGGAQEAELALPVPQHVRLEVGELADLADREELLDGMRGAHRHCSALRSRSIRSATAWRAGLPANRTALTSRTIGSSTSRFSPGAAAARAVSTPSATVFFPFRAAASDWPRPIASPSARLRDKGPVAVRIRSPIPARPADVSGLAPHATPSRVISASPRVISAARVLYPRPRPSRMPVASAMTFFSAPPSSTPMTSVDEYTRNCGVEKICCASRAISSVSAAATTAVGWPLKTSCAKDGPDTTAIGVPDSRASLNTSLIVASRSGSSPLVTLITSAWLIIAFPASVITARTACDGAADTTTSACRTASRRSPVARSSTASLQRGRNIVLMWRRVVPSTPLASRAPT